MGRALWRHNRAWLPPEELAPSRALRARAAAEGPRQPVQVIEGNYELGVNTCAWWDGVRVDARR